MKKVMFVLIIVTNILSLIACGKSTESNTNVKIKYNGNEVSLSQDVNGNVIVVTPPPVKGEGNMEGTGNTSVVGSGAFAYEDNSNNKNIEATTDNDKSVDKKTETVEKSNRYEKIDIDLSAMSGTMAYSEVYNIYYSIEEHKGKVVKARGKFFRTSDPNTGAVYDICCIFDSTGCCAQQIEFDNKEEADKLAAEQEFTVVGKLDMYYENDIGYLILRDSEVIA